MMKEEPINFCVVKEEPQEKNYFLYDKNNGFDLNLGDVERENDILSSVDQISDILENKPSNSDLCGENMDGEPLKVKSQEFLECCECNYRTTVKKRLTAHRKIHSSVRRFTCEICGYKALYLYLLKIHLRRHRGEKRFTCPFCDFKSVTRSKIGEHLLVHSGKKTFLCSYCPKSFKAKSDCKIHERIHTGELPYLCQICGKGFKRCSRYNEHIRLHESNKEKVPVGDQVLCNICNKIYKNQSTLNYHFKSVHRKTFTCRNCDYNAESKNDLKKHMFSHSDKKRLSCDMCSYTTLYIRNFKNHLERHLPDSSDLKFSCNKCEKLFSCQWNLTRHMKVHNGNNVCQHCQYSCAEKNKMKLHMKTHVEKNSRFECEKCGYKFVYKNSLVRHLKRTHRMEL